ncbi:unnamed protein product [Nezara viridula]|uniref:Uncharacterized protein n=1 Tax=Nezara viridula TaxID=85310 RepID=A0A9P0H5H1_NEZVI|nr:unnamed protein product [Nezara viridula]
MTERSIPHIRDIFDSERSNGTQVDRKRPVVGPRSEPDLKHLDRHLSMKKTIRKKIMRDLQQAFVAESGEKDVEIVVDTTGREGFLDVLRRGGKEEKEEVNDSKDEEKKQGFWRRFTIRRNKR